MKVLWLDGKWRRGCEPPPDRVAWGAFTTVGCDDGRPLLWGRHRARLQGTLRALAPGSRAELPRLTELCRLLAENRLTGPARLRVTARWADGTGWRVTASATACREAGPGLDPLTLAIESWPAAPPLAGHKTLARLAWDLARETARRAAADDALLVDSKGRLLETSVANVWVVRGRRIATPPAPSRCLPGVMRNLLLERVEDIGLEPIEEDIGLSDLARAGEVWISNAVVGVRRVARVGDRQWRRWPAFERLEALGLPAPGWPPPPS